MWQNLLSKKGHNVNRMILDTNSHASNFHEMEQGQKGDFYLPTRRPIAY